MRLGARLQRSTNGVFDRGALRRRNASGEDFEIVGKLDHVEKCSRNATRSENDFHATALNFPRAAGRPIVCWDKIGGRTTMTDERAPRPLDRVWLTRS